MWPPWCGRLKAGHGVASCVVSVARRDRRHQSATRVGVADAAVWATGAARRAPLRVEWRRPSPQRGGEGTGLPVGGGKARRAHAVRLLRADAPSAPDVLAAIGERRPRFERP